MINRMGLSIKRGGSNPGDLHLDDKGNLVLVFGGEAVAQHVRQRLMTYEGEWFLDRAVGVPWLRDILGEQYDPALAEAVIKAEILDSDGVVDINSFSVRFDRSSRGLSAYDIEVITEFDGEVSL